jgi:hypothetical protein
MEELCDLMVRVGKNAASDALTVQEVGIFVSSLAMLSVWLSVLHKTKSL